MSDLVGRTLGQYRIEESIGVGGMATVYRAYQPGLDRYVAIKFIRPEFVTEEGFRARFEREARTIARLSHPNIVHVYDFGEEGNRYYLVMEFIVGGTLKDRLQSLSDAGEIMDLDEAHRIIRQVGDALDHAHQQGVIHRDIKPANIMLPSDGRAVLNDFGLAKMVEATSGLTTTGAITGTPAYMSPEQIEGDKTKIGPASDLYSLGVVLYEMVTGRVPFTADTPLAVILKHLHDPIPLPSTLNPALPEDVERIMLKALAKDPAARYQVADELGRELERALQGRLPVPTVPLRPTAQPVRWPRISWLRASVLIVSVLIIAGGIAIARGIVGTWLQSGEKEALTTRPPGSTAAVLASLTLTSTLFSEATSVSAPAPTAAPTDAPTNTPTYTPTLTARSTFAVRPTPTPIFTSTPTPPSVTPEEKSQLISIVQRFPAPGRRTEGITWDGTHLWLSDNSGTIFQIDTLGRTLGAFSSPEVTPKGLAWDGSSLWVFTTNYSFIYQFQIEGQETKTISSFKSPARVFGGAITQDMAWDGESLWYANQYNVYRLDTLGKILSSFAFPKNVSGLDWDGSNLWLAYNDFPSNSTLVVVDTEGSTLGSYPSPVFQTESLAWGDGHLWAAGRDSLAGESVICKLDVSSAKDVITPSSDTTWQAKVLSVRELFVLEASFIGTDGIPKPFQYYAGEGRTFIIVELGLKSQVMGATLYTEDIWLTDDRGHAYSAVGTQINTDPMPEQFAIGTLTGMVTLSRSEPPVLTFEFEIKRVVGSSTSTTRGEMPVAAPDGEWPEVVLVWLVPADASGLQLTVPGTPASRLAESPATPHPPTAKPTETSSPTPKPLCPAASGPFAATWNSVQETIGCATNNALTGFIVEENFEGGRMFWREPIDYAQILALFSDGTWQIVKHSPFIEGSPEFSCPDADTPSRCPPTPKRGFGMVWCDTPEVSARLGNALDCERGYQGSMQQLERGFMLQTDSKAVYVFYDDGRWERR